MTFQTPEERPVVFGVLCEKDCVRIKIWCFYKRELVDITDIWNVDFEVGRLYEVKNGKVTKRMYTKKIEKAFNIRVVTHGDGDFQIKQVLAVHLSEDDLPEDCHVYGDKVMCYPFGALADPKGLVRKNRHQWVNIKYAPHKDTIFEVFEVAPPPSEPKKEEPEEDDEKENRKRKEWNDEEEFKVSMLPVKRMKTRN